MRICKENDAIYKKKEVGNFGIVVVHKERRVRKGRTETYRLDERIEMLKPGSWSLFETIKRFLEKTDMIWIGRIFKTKRLLIIDGLLKRTTKESIFYI